MLPIEKSGARGEVKGVVEKEVAPGAESLHRRIYLVPSSGRHDAKEVRGCQNGL